MERRKGLYFLVSTLNLAMNPCAVCNYKNYKFTTDANLKFV